MIKKGPAQGPFLASEAPAASRPPRLAPGVERVGEFTNGGSTVSGFLLRRGDGSMVMVSQLLFWLTEEIDGQKDFPELAERLSVKLGRTIDTEALSYLVERKLQPLGVMAGAPGDLNPPAGVLALTGRAALIPPHVVRPAAALLQNWFRPPIVGVVLASVLAADLWLLQLPGSQLSRNALVNEPATMLAVVGLTLLGALFHELGHAAASLYGGAQPGKIGVCLYIVWPAFFTDITESYRLGRRGRIRTDLGGIYFNLILVLLLESLYLHTGSPLWIWAALAQHLMILQQFVPFLRLDGYYLMSDLTGVPDLFGHVRPFLSRLVPGREVDRRFTDLKPWVRAAVTVWVLSTVTILGWFGVQLLLGIPRILPAGWELTSSLWNSTTSNLRSGRLAAGSAQLVETILMSIQLVGLVLLLARVIQWICRYARGAIMKLSTGRRNWRLRQLPVR
jgi:putative peptide zinc metalloprotease protein